MSETPKRPKPSDILFSTTVRKMQSKQGAAAFINKLINREHWKSHLSQEQIDFIQNRDSFYLGTASLEGRPYIHNIEVDEKAL